MIAYKLTHFWFKGKIVHLKSLSLAQVFPRPVCGRRDLGDVWKSTDDCQELFIFEDRL